MQRTLGVVSAPGARLIPESEDDGGDLPIETYATRGSTGEVAPENGLHVGHRLLDAGQLEA